jgi:hypothetical protein
MKQLAPLLPLIGFLVISNTQVQVPPEDHALSAFLLAAYPELSGRALQIRSNGKTAARDISVFEVIPTGMVEPLLKRKRPTKDVR